MDEGSPGTVPVVPTLRHRRGGRARLAIPATLALAITLGTVAWAFGVFATDEPPGTVGARQAPLLPDLAMGPIQDIAVGTTELQQQRLRFSATIVNIGQGPLVVRARRAWVGDQGWTVDQWLQEPSGAFSVRPTDADLIFGGDGHGHWHVKQVEVHQIETMDGTVLGRLVKQGFCFFDTDAYTPDLPGAPGQAHWGARGCASTVDTRVQMGLSVGWGDKYPWNLLDERIDVTDIPDGPYRIRQIADPNDAFEESDETNNETWVDIELVSLPDGLRDAKVIQAGPAPAPAPAF